MDKFEEVMTYLVTNPKCSDDTLKRMIGALPWHEVERAKRLIKIVEKGY